MVHLRLLLHLCKMTSHWGFPLCRDADLLQMSLFNKFTDQTWIHLLGHGFFSASWEVLAHHPLTCL